MSIIYVKCPKCRCTVPIRSECNDDICCSCGEFFDVGQSSEPYKEEQHNYDNSEFLIRNGVLLKYLGNASEVNIPDTVTEIGDGAFYTATQLKNRDSKQRQIHQR